MISRANGSGIILCFGRGGDGSVISLLKMVLLVLLNIMGSVY